MLSSRSGSPYMRKLQVYRRRITVGLTKGVVGCALSHNFNLQSILQFASYTWAQVLLVQKALRVFLTRLLET